MIVRLPDLKDRPGDLPVLVQTCWTAPWQHGQACAGRFG
jgi:hypothetical protein